MNPSTYRHYKGGVYTLLYVAETHHHNGDKDAEYLSHTTGKVVTRPFERDSRNDDSWIDFVQWPDGVLRYRFSLVQEPRACIRLSSHDNLPEHTGNESCKVCNPPALTFPISTLPVTS